MRVFSSGILPRGNEDYGNNAGVEDVSRFEKKKKKRERNLLSERQRENRVISLPRNRRQEDREVVASFLKGRKVLVVASFQLLSSIFVNRPRSRSWNNTVGQQEWQQRQPEKPPPTTVFVASLLRIYDLSYSRRREAPLFTLRATRPRSRVAMNGDREHPLPLLSSSIDDVATGTRSRSRADSISNRNLRSQVQREIQKIDNFGIRE